MQNDKQRPLFTGIIVAGYFDQKWLARPIHLAFEGHLWIEITPMDTYELVAPPPLTPAAGDILAMLGGIAVPLGIGAVVIVVVVVVYVKKFKK